jgi:hypothetical protein
MAKSRGIGRGGYRHGLPGGSIFNCVNCGAQFRSYDKRRRFCSLDCANKVNSLVNIEKARGYQREPVAPYTAVAVLICTNCSKQFIARRKKKYCSACKDVARKAQGKSGPRKPPNRVCFKCGKHFRSPPSDPQRYCSYECHLASGGAQRAGAASKRMMAFYGTKKDANHSEILKLLNQMHVGFWDMSTQGGGMPDLLVYCGGRYHWWEIKNPNTSYGRKGLNNLQRIWAENSKGGPVHVIHSLEEAEAFVLANGWQSGQKAERPIISVSNVDEALEAVGVKVPSSVA